MLGKNAGVSRSERVKRLGRDGIEQRTDRVGVGRLQPRIGLKAKPCSVFLVDVVVDACGLYLFMVIAGMGNALPVRTAISVVRGRGWTSADVERTTEHSKRRSTRAPVEREHLFIERYRLRSSGIDRSGDRIRAAKRKLVQDILLKCQSGHRS